MGNLYLVRHGQASFLQQNYDKLSPLGEAQSRLLGEYWAPRGVISIAFASVRARARKTPSSWFAPLTSLPTSLFPSRNCCPSSTNIKEKQCSSTA